MHNWANRGPSMKSGNVSCEGPRLYSYAEVIGEFHVAPNGEPFVILSDKNWSMTTSRHQSYAGRALSLQHRRIHVHRPRATPAEWVQELAERVAEALGKARRARSNRGWHLAAADHLFKNLTFLATAYSLPAPASIEGVADLILEHTAAIEAQRRLDEAARRERQRLNELEQAEAIEQWLRGERTYCPHTEHPRLRLSGRRHLIETSWGAAVPVDVAEPLVRLSRERRGTLDLDIPVGSFHLTEVTSDGSLRIGCHLIQVSEVERMAAILFPEQAAA
jgi:hypothetical protein